SGWRSNMVPGATIALYVPNNPCQYRTSWRELGAPVSGHPLGCDQRSLEIHGQMSHLGESRASITAMRFEPAKQHIPVAGHHLVHTAHRLELGGCTRLPE